MPDEPIPDQTNRQLVIDHLLESIAKEELALANILNAQAAKINAFVGENFDFPTHPSNREIISINNSSMRILRMVVMKEWLTLSRLEEIFDFDSKEIAHSSVNPFTEVMNNLEDTPTTEEGNEILDEPFPSEDNKDDMIDSSGIGENDEFSAVPNEED